MARKILTASNGRPYVLKSDGRAEFVTFKAAKAAGWSKPAAAKKKPAAKAASKRSKK
jgi:hypothetical protein